MPFWCLPWFCAYCLLALHRFCSCLPFHYLTPTPAHSSACSSKSLSASSSSLSGFPPCFVSIIFNIWCYTVPCIWWSWIPNFELLEHKCNVSFDSQSSLPWLPSAWLGQLGFNYYLLEWVTLLTFIHVFTNRYPKEVDSEFRHATIPTVESFLLVELA